MASFAIPNFKFGLDQRRPRVAGALGTCWDLNNAHLTRGGDIERSKAFVLQYTLPAGTFGMTSVASRLFVFGSADLAASMPPGINYQQLVAENGANMIAVLTSVAFIGNTYVIAEYDDGNVRHFYNAVRVTDWDTVADVNCSFASLTDYLSTKANGSPDVEATAYANTLLLTSKTAGVATAVSALAVDGGGTGDQTAVAAIIQAAVPAVAETRAIGTLSITGGTFSPGANRVANAFVGATPLMLAPADWNSSNSATANAVAAQINNMSATSGYSASALGADITITAAPGTGATPNGFVVSSSVLGNVTTTKVDMAGGVTAVAAVSQIATVTLGGTFESLDKFSITIGANTYSATGRASGMGSSAYVWSNRVYCCANTHLKYCKINDPSNWTDASASSGAGFINIASQTNGSERLTAVAPYSAYHGIFSLAASRLYSLTADATQVSFFQTISNSGCIAPLSLQPFANTDVFYLSTSGIRSLRARDTTDKAYAADVGAAIDTPLQAWLAQVGPTVAFGAVSIFEPLDQRYMVAVGSRIWVYSYFPASQVGAWSYYSPADANGAALSMTAFAAIKNRLYCRAGNAVYLYGGLSGQVYPAAGICEPSFSTPFLSAALPDAVKIWTSYDIAAKGTWQVTFLVDPNDETKTINGGVVVNNSFSGPANEVAGRSPLFALKMDCVSGGYASFSGFIDYFLEKSGG